LKKTIFIAVFFLFSHTLFALEGHKDPPPLTVNKSKSVKLGGEVTLPITDFPDGYCYGHSKVYGSYMELLANPKIKAVLSSTSFDKKKEILAALNEVEDKLQSNKGINFYDKLVMKDLIQFFRKNPTDLGTDYLRLVNNDEDFGKIVEETHEHQMKDWFVAKEQVPGAMSKKQVPPVVEDLIRSMKTQGSDYPVLGYGLKGKEGGHVVTVESISTSGKNYVIKVRDSLFPKTMTTPKSYEKNNPDSEPRLEIVVNPLGEVLSFKTKLDKTDQGADIISKNELQNLRLSTFTTKDKYSPSP
jgi:hypothetical protein